jgi:hypothetical protein
MTVAKYYDTASSSWKPIIVGATAQAIVQAATAPADTSLLWLDTSISSTTLKVQDLSDAVISSPLGGQLLTYNGTNWINSATISGLTLASPTVTGTLGGASITASGTLSVTSTTTLTGALTANGGISTTSVSASTTLGATGATTLGSTLSVTGLSTLTGGATTGGNTTLTLGASTGGASGNAPLKLSSGTVITTPAAGAVEYDGTITTLTSNTSVGRAPIATPVFTSGVGTSGVAATTNYPLFPAANDTITLPVGTYRVELSVRMLVATSVVSSAFPFNIRGSGTAVGTLAWDGTASITDGGAANEFQIASTAITTTSSMALSAASGAAGRVYLVRGSGILKITTAGTIIPSYYWAAAQTSGVVTLYADNYMIVTPLSSSGTSTSTGAWA